MKIINKRSAPTPPKFEFAYGKVYYEKLERRTWLCVNTKPPGMGIDLALVEITDSPLSCLAAHELPNPDPIKWEEVEATLTITNK